MFVKILSFNLLSDDGFASDEFDEGKTILYLIYMCISFLAPVQSCW